MSSSIQVSLSVLGAPLYSYLLYLGAWCLEPNVTVQSVTWRTSPENLKPGNHTLVAWFTTIHCGLRMVRGFCIQKVSWPKWACSAPITALAGNPSKSRKPLQKQAFFLLWSPDLLIEHTWPEVVLGLCPVTANAFLQTCIPFCYGLAHTFLALTSW